MQRPTSVTVFGILNLVFAALGLCGMAFGVLGLVMIEGVGAQMRSQENQRQPAAQVIPEDAGDDDGLESYLQDRQDKEIKTTESASPDPPAARAEINDATDLDPGGREMPPGNPQLDILKPQFDLMKNPAWKAWTYANIILGGIAAIVLAIAGIGLLQLKSWGRALSIAYSGYAILMQIVGLVVTIVFVIRPMMEAAEQAGGNAQAGLVGGIIGGTAGGCIGLIYPVLLMFFMFRPNVKAAFGVGQDDGDMMNIPDDNPTFTPMS